MNKKFFFLSLFFLFIIFSKGIMSEEKKELIYLELKNGRVIIETKSDLAPNHVERIKELVLKGYYNGVVFHRVIEGFMAQTGDVKFGNSTTDDYILSRAGTGGSALPDLKAEFSKVKHGRGAVSMARAKQPDSANSQFFICFKDCSFLDGQYTLWGQVIEGMEYIDQIKLGEGDSGAVKDPDKIIKMELATQ